MAKHDGSGQQSQEEQKTATHIKNPVTGDVSLPSSPDHPAQAETGEAEDAGPVVTMQGVGGKKIHSTVKVVKVKKKAKPEETTAAMEEGSTTAKQPVEAKPDEASPAASSSSKEETPTPAKAAKSQQTEKLAEPVAAVESTETIPSKTTLPTPRKVGRMEVLHGATERRNSEKAAQDEGKVTKAKRARRAGEERQDEASEKRASASGRGQQRTERGRANNRMTAAEREQAAREEEKRAAMRRAAEAQKAAEEAQKQRQKEREEAQRQAEEAKQKAAAEEKARQEQELLEKEKLERTAAQAAKAAAETASETPSEQEKAPEAKTAEAATVAAAASEKNKTEASKERTPKAPQRAAEPSTKAAVPGPDAPNRGQGPTREAKPSGQAGVLITPGKVGNIFDRQGAKSDLAATAQAFAQRRRRQESGAAGHAGGASAGTGRRTPQNGAGRFGGATRGARPQNGRPQGGRPGSENFMDKDREPENNRSRRSSSRRPAAPTSEGFGGRSSEGQRNSGFAQRAAYDRNKRSRNNRGSDREESSQLTRDKVRGRSTHNKPVVSQLTHVSLPGQLTVKELAEALKKTAAEVIKQLMGLGVMATANQTIDYDTASIIAGEFGVETDQLEEIREEDILFHDEEDDPDKLEARPPVVVIMGHVDHGKTSLLDYIRKSKVAAGEAGGITQHIGAYMVRVDDRKITFLDTPGHEAFTTMRARGAQATDIAILVVAADDGVMPQTVEAINHAKAAETEIVVAINKIDKPGANVDKVKQELAQHNLIPEEWGGTTPMVPISAHTGEGIDELLENVLLVAEVMELKANPQAQAKGIIIESQLDRNRGTVASLLVQRGTLKVGDTVVAGASVGNVRAMIDANGRQVKKAGPSMPVEVLGLPEVPEAGEVFYAVDDERAARQYAERFRQEQRESKINKPKPHTLDTIYSRLKEGEMKSLNLVIKADVVGSVEAVTQSMLRLTNEEVRVHVVHGAVGAITESDVRLAEVSNAIIIGFNVRPSKQVTDLAEETGVDIRLYRIIYNAIEDVEAAMKGMLAPTIVEEVTGHAEIRETFHVSSIGTIGGAYVTDGKINRNSEVRLVRDGIVIHEGKLASLRRFKDDVREVAQGYECGISLERYNDIKIGDVIEAFVMQEVQRT